MPYLPSLQAESLNPRFNFKTGVLKLLEYKFVHTGWLVATMELLGKNTVLLIAIMVFFEKNNFQIVTAMAIIIAFETGH